VTTRLESDDSILRHFGRSLMAFTKRRRQLGNLYSQGHCPFSTLNLKIRPAAKELQARSDKKVDHAASQLAMVQEILHRLEIAQDN
jgi:hypothetical protein